MGKSRTTIGSNSEGGTIFDKVSSVTEFCVMANFP